jgi:glycosyltransferase involved in cell wall biosynthesis
VVTTDVGNVSNVCLPGTTAILVPPGNAAEMASAIARVIEGNALVGAATAGPPFVAREFEWDLCVDRMELVLDRAAGS